MGLSKFRGLGFRGFGFRVAMYLRGSWDLVSRL